MTSKKTTVKPWDGRFDRATDKFVEQFTESVSFDQRLYRHDIAGSIAHARMLAGAKVLKKSECDRIVTALKAIEKEIDAGKFKWRRELEDVHMNIETALVRRIGEVGKKLHTGRSRNDQIATDLRLYLREEVDAVRAQLLDVMSSLLDLAAGEAGTVMPGLTHLQIAQPVTFGHHMLAWYEMLKRDEQRFAECRRRINVLPLGSAALAGTTFPVDRDYVAELLEFDDVAANSMDAVSDRDFAIEFNAAAAVLLMHLSRFSEEIILWMSPQFGYIDLDDAFCTGSSIMPQKKNPDVPELVRGKSARVYGNLMALLTLMKAQPLAYNRDNQEDKQTLFDTVDTTRACLAAYREMIPAMSVNRTAMKEAAGRGFATATDLADYLVRNNVPFRDAHAVVGKIVKHAIRRGKTLSELTLAELRKFSTKINEDIFDYLELNGSIAARDHIGGTAPTQVKQAVKQGRSYLKARQKKV
jgi:argininosuccinate lyase